MKEEAKEGARTRVAKVAKAKTKANTTMPTSHKCLQPWPEARAGQKLAKAFVGISTSTLARTQSQEALAPKVCMFAVAVRHQNTAMQIAHAKRRD